MTERGSKPERGFVFIQEAGSTRDPNIFAHVSAFPPPYRGESFYDVIGRAVSFDIETGPDNRRRAVRVELFDENEVTGQVA